MPTKYIPGRGYVTTQQQMDDEEAGLYEAPQITPGMTELDYQNMMYLEGQRSQTNQQLQSAPIEPVKPLIGGETFTDVLQAFPNAAVAIPTDIMDLGAGLIDTIGETYKAVTNDDYDFNDSGEWFDDSNNPWTAWRRDNMGTSSTYAGEFVSTGLRIATLFVPISGWLKAGASLPQLGKLTKLGQYGSKLSKAANRIAPAARTAGTADRLTDLAQGFQKGSQAARAARMALKNPYLDLSYKAVSEVPQLGNWWKRTQTATNAMFKTKFQFRNLAETVAFDALGGFMIYGEGDEAMDETMFDLMASLGVDVPLDWQTTIQDTAIERKMFGILDGTFIGVIGGGLVDIFRLRRYADALKKASPGQRQQILKAFRKEAEGIGDNIVTLGEKRFMRQGSDFANSPVQNALAQKAGVASDLGEGTVENFAKAQPADLPEPVPGLQDPFTYDANRLPPGQQGGALQLNTLVDQVERARLDQQSQALAGIKADEAERANRLTKQGAAGFVSREGQPQLQGTTTPGRAPTDSTPLDRAPFPDNAPGGTGVDPARVTVLGQSNVEPTITPQTMRRAIREAMDAGMPYPQIKAGVQKILPEKRVNQIDYLDAPDLFNRSLVQRNEAGVIPAADSLIFNEILNRGLKEGWVAIDPQTFALSINRRVALDLDQADLANKAARGIDQAEDARRYEEYLRSADTTNNDSMRPEVQADLQAKDAEGVTSSTEGFTVPDPAAQAGMRQAEEAGLQSQALSEEELARMTNDITAGADPDDVIADGLSLRPEDIPSYEVQKVGRQYQVLDPNGEPIEKGLYTTKKQAAKRVERENGLLKEGVLKRAQQQIADGNFQPLDWDKPRAMYDSEILAKVSLTESQAKAIQQYLTGPASDLLGGKRTLELPQNQLNEIAGDIRARLANDEVDASQRRVLNNLADKIDIATEAVVPAVRRQRMVDDVARGVNRYLSHGDYC